MCFGRIILPIETNESTVFLLNFKFGANLPYKYTTLHIFKTSGVKNLFELDRTSYFKV